MKVGHPIGDSAPEVVAAGIRGMRRERLRRRHEIIGIAFNIPPDPGRLADSSLRQKFARRRNVAPIDAKAADPVGPPAAVQRKVYGRIQAQRLDVSSGPVEALVQLEAVLEGEVIEQVFGLDSEEAIQIQSAAD